MYIQTNDLNEIVLTHQDPYNPVYGLGMTEEELLTKGFFLKGVRSLPSVEQMEDHYVVFFSDGKSIWYEYKALETAENLQRDVQYLVQNKAEQDRLIKESLEHARTARDKAMGVEEMNTLMTMESGLLALDLMEKEIILNVTQQKLLSTESELGITKQKLAASDETVAQTKSDLALTQKDLADLVMMMIGGDM